MSDSSSESAIAEFPSLLSASTAFLNSSALKKVSVSVRFFLLYHL